VKRGGQRLCQHVGLVEDQLNIVLQLGLVPFDQHYIVAATLHDAFGNGALGEQGIHGDPPQPSSQQTLLVKSKMCEKQSDIQCLKAQETMYIPLVTCPPMALEIESRELTNRVCSDAGCPPSLHYQPAPHVLQDWDLIDLVSHGWLPQGQSQPVTEHGEQMGGHQTWPTPPRSWPCLAG
jgi:hypothetical protein